MARQWLSEWLGVARQWLSENVMPFSDDVMGAIVGFVGRLTRRPTKQNHCRIHHGINNPMNQSRTHHTIKNHQHHQQKHTHHQHQQTTKRKRNAEQPGPERMGVGTFPVCRVARIKQIVWAYLCRPRATLNDVGPAESHGVLSRSCFRVSVEHCVLCGVVWWWMCVGVCGFVCLGMLCKKLTVFSITGAADIQKTFFRLLREMSSHFW